MNIGVTTVRVSNPAKALSPAQRKAWAAAVPQCESSARVISALGGRSMSAFAGGSQGNKLTPMWMRIESRVFAAAPVRAADRRAAACSQHTPFSAKTVGAEQSAVEAKLTPLNTKEARAVNAAGVRVLIRCFGAVERLREHPLQVEQAKFFAQHASAIAQMKDQVDRLVAADEAKYGIKLGVTSAGPTPKGLGYAAAG